MRRPSCTSAREREAGDKTGAPDPRPPRDAPPPDSGSIASPGQDRRPVARRTPLAPIRGAFGRSGAVASGHAIVESVGGIGGPCALDYGFVGGDLPGRSEGTRECAWGFECGKAEGGSGGGLERGRFSLDGVAASVRESLEYLRRSMDGGGDR